MDNKVAKLLVCASALTYIVVATAAPASAQSTAVQSTSNPPKDMSSDRAAPPDANEIIVTAYKTAQSLDKSAVAVTAIRGDDLTSAGVTSARQLAGAIPGLQAAQLGSVVNLNIRGVGSSQFSPLSGSAVGFVQDGVPLQGNIGLTNGFYDVDRIEVLKGPQGTIYGADATGGVVSVVTARPRIGETSGSLSGEGGNYGHYQLEGYVNVPLGENLAARVSGIYNRRDGYISDTYEDAKEGGVRGQLLYRAETWSLLLAGDYFHEGGIGSGAVALPLGRGTPDGNPFNSTYYPTKGTDARRDNNYYGIRAELNADLGFADLTILPSYRKIKTDEIQYMSGYRADVQNDMSQTSVEARLSHKTDKVEWLAGLYALWGQRSYQGFFYNANADFASTSPLNNFFDPAATSISANGVSSETPAYSQAAFGQVTYSITPQFRVTGGLRYSHDIRKVDPNIDYVLNTTLAPPVLSSFIPIQQVGGIARTPGAGFSLASLQAQDPNNLFITTQTSSQSARFNHVDFKIGAQYDLSPEVMLYSNLSTGYKSGGVNTYSTADISTVYKPEKLTSLEGGVRAHVGTFRLHANLFYWWYKDHQEGAIYNIPSIGTKLLIENIPSGHMYGLDLEAGWKPTPNDSLGLELGYLESNTGPFVIGAGQATEVNEPNGHPYVAAPRWTLNGNYEHVFPIGGYELVARGEGHFQSAQNLEIRFTSATRQGSYFTGNALLTFQPHVGKWYIGAYVRNLTDETYLVAAQKAPGVLPDFFGNLGAPRTYGVRAGIKF
ncbi:TonB-dependent receptor [Sphingomonas fuzhouensis]|uniref:TonB-dependent receptor n=1 Tax=Sphingomonas fuzhouensis TaxID=3106033 RepID=UPI002AFE51F6|nr:TonB-dependent receptor [Sphingomonas sp. SGZ-02]